MEIDWHKTDFEFFGEFNYQDQFDILRQRTESLWSNDKGDITMTWNNFAHCWLLLTWQGRIYFGMPPKLFCTHKDKEIFVTLKVLKDPLHSYLENRNKKD